MVWDLPTRLFHWGFAVSIIGAFISGERGATEAHEYFGLAAMGLFVFRLIWGFIGYETARLSRLLTPPRFLLGYVKDILARRIHRPTFGHNPLGGLAVIALLTVMGVMAVTGLWTGDDVLYEAPLTIAGIAPELASPMAVWHERLHFLVPLLVLIHVLAIVLHRLWLGEKLVTRMITGGADNTQEPKKPSPGQTALGLVLLFICVGGALSLSLLTPSYG